jgi:aconitate hydratase
MSQKILAGRADDPSLEGELVRVKVDQVILAREPVRVLSETSRLGMKKAAVEVAIAYDTRCVTSEATNGCESLSTGGVANAALQQGVLIARPGIGFASAVHLERFGSPARLALTDEPRLAAIGGAGMLALPSPPSQLAEALSTGWVSVRPARSIQVLLSGRVRPFVCVRDVALELVRRGLGDLVEKVDRERRAPVVIEFSGPSARLLSVPDRAVLCALAPQLGAAGAVFVSDEKTEVYLRDQRRSKAHRSLLPDPGAPCDDVLTVDLSAVDPLLMDHDGSVRPVRELAGRPVTQVVLGGDSGAPLRDLLAAAALLKSKRVPPGLDFLLAPPSRQALEVLAQSGALVDLIATGARLLEPDQRLITGELYPPESQGTSLRSFDPEPKVGAERRFVVASAETLAYAVATGQVGDPRGFKRPVRVTVPRALPTDDVLIMRKSRPRKKGDEETRNTAAVRSFVETGWTEAATLSLRSSPAELSGPSALLLNTLEDVRWVGRQAADLSTNLRAVIAPYIPSGIVSVLSGLGILALTGAEDTLRKLEGQSALSVPDPKNWNGTQCIDVTAGKLRVQLSWLAVGAERDWAARGTTRARPDDRESELTSRRAPAARRLNP